MEPRGDIASRGNFRDDNDRRFDRDHHDDDRRFDVETENVELKLTETDPFKRLREFCYKGRYKYRFYWNKFSNGILCQCVISSRRGIRWNILTSEVMFVNTADVFHAQKAVSNSLLSRIGL